jgi:hypothetical protein
LGDDLFGQETATMTPVRLILTVAMFTAFLAPLIARAQHFLPADHCYGRVARNVGTGEAQTKGAKYIEIVAPKDRPNKPVCIAFDEVARQILRTCPVGSTCWIDGDIPGDDGMQKIWAIRREKK